jgi:cellulose synthase/poly-beta-1,6-N-acetylglucosamine synthase-like glycosyltransferase
LIYPYYAINNPISKNNIIMINILLIAIATVFLCQGLVLFIQVVSSFIPARRVADDGRRPSVAIIMPAHNEEEVISQTLQIVIPQLLPGDRLLVVADNCQDRTAELARAAGAEVVVREDLQNRGKGYALDYGVRCLEATPPEVVVIIDADCFVTPNLLDKLAKDCLFYQRPVQALYLMQNSSARPGLKSKIAEFAWVVKNQVRPLGFLRLGLPCQLMGTGMAFPWDLMVTAQLATSHIVEDMKMGLDFAKIGKPPLFCPDALVTSFFPNTEAGTKSQRTRWEHGHLALVLNESPKLLLAGIFKRDLQLFALAADLCVPPLALLIIMMLAVLIVNALWCAFSLNYAPLLLSVLSLAICLASVVLAWTGFARHILSWYDLAFSWLYIVKKIPLYIQFCFNKQLEWVKTKRDES